MTKKLGIFFIMVLMVSNLVSCSGGSYRITIGEINSTQNVMSGKYNSFSGYYFKKVKLEDGENLKVAFSVDTEKGILNAKVIDSDGKTIKTLSTGETVTINQPGQYKLQVEGDKHKGNFTLCWKIK